MQEEVTSEPDSVLLLVRKWDLETNKISEIHEFTLPQNETCDAFGAKLEKAFGIKIDNLQGTRMKTVRYSEYDLINSEWNEVKGIFYVKANPLHWN